MSISDLDSNQIIQKVYDAAGGGLKFTPVSGLVSVVFDAISVTYPTTTQEVYEYRSGGISGTVVATLTLNYVDATKAQLLNVARS